MEKKMRGFGFPSDTLHSNCALDGRLEDRVRGRNALGIAMITCMGIGLGLQLNEHQSMKSIARGIKFANGVVKGLKAIHKLHSHTSELGMANAVFLAFQAAKALAKSAKGVAETRGLNIISKDRIGRFSKISKGIKLSEGAMNLVRYSTKDCEGTGLSAWNTLIKGYKLSKGALNVIEGAGGLQGRVVSAASQGMAFIKGGVEGVGVILKAIFVSRNLYAFLIKGLGISGGGLQALQILAEEYNNAISVGKTPREVCFRMRRRHGICCARISRFSSAGNEPLIYVLAKTLVCHRGRMQRVGSDSASLFYLSLPSPRCTDPPLL